MYRLGFSSLRGLWLLLILLRFPSVHFCLLRLYVTSGTVVPYNMSWGTSDKDFPNTRLLMGHLSVGSWDWRRKVVCGSVIPHCTADNWIWLLMGNLETLIMQLTTLILQSVKASPCDQWQNCSLRIQQRSPNHSAATENLSSLQEKEGSVSHNNPTVSVAGSVEALDSD